MCIKNRLSGEKCVLSQVCKVAYLIVDLLSFLSRFSIHIIKAGFIIVFFFFLFCFVFFVFLFCFLFLLLLLLLFRT